MPHFIGIRTLFEIDHTATPDDIKKAYRKLSRQYHPDLNSGEEAEVMMKKVTEYYEILTNPKKGEEYAQIQKDKKRAAAKAVEKKNKVAKARKNKKKNKK